MQPRWWAVLAVAAWLAAGCSERVARPINPGAPRCQESLRDALGLILIGQEEKPEVADAIAVGVARELAELDLAPGAFKVSSPSGTDYAFLFENDGSRCLLHLAVAQKGSVKYVDNVTYIATRPLAGCRCER